MEVVRVDLLDEKVSRLEEQVERLVAGREAWDELLVELQPVLRGAMGAAVDRLGELDRRGYGAFARELVGVVDSVVTGFEPEDVRALAGGVVELLETVRAVTRPEVLGTVRDVSTVMTGAQALEPLGWVGAARATRDVDVQRGLAVAVEVLRLLGRTETSAPATDRRQQRLDALLGPRRKARVSGRPSEAAPLPPPPSPALRRDGPLSSFDALPGDAWTAQVAAERAGTLGMELTDAHMAIVRVCRGAWEVSGSAPNVRSLTQLAGVDTRTLYGLFPRSPGKTVAYLAGCPKPAGCL